MPRLIDHDERRQHLALAVWRVIAREGVGAVSVRTVAAEAGVSAGSLRHVLPTKSELLAAAMRLTIDRATARFIGAAQGVATVERAVEWLSELLPLDEERRVEMEIQLALTAESAAHPGLRGIRDEGTAGLREACRSVLVDGAHEGVFPDFADLERETTRLHVLLDGLAFHLVGGSTVTTPEVAIDLLRSHLEQLRDSRAARSSGGTSPH
ncbi:TetR/AcrR family transcriptional regulator [Nocardioides sp. SYSU D00065]|uniref:TetR/AcrR family transcriptional regulator n=1 Tax=Nocardioides sp. SYSU D00065 TaxID=2817378 RepID=UPI001B3261D9|nr:TetR family transcriptional regulator C-terminal domain-containing protein [Nocardioides sp. SYSU D00065]